MIILIILEKYNFMVTETDLLVQFIHRQIADLLTGVT